MTASRAAPVAQRLAALLVAGGRGERMGGTTPKQFRLLEGRMLLMYALEALAESPLVHGIVVVVPGGWEDRVREELRRERLHERVESIVRGGETRQQSVRRGLHVLAQYTHVLVHDAARPFLTQALIRTTVAAVHRKRAATVAVPVSDTLMRSAAGEQTAEAVHAIDRQGVWAVQTPQAFELALLLEAHEEARRKGLDASDDGTLVLDLGRTVEFVRGTWWNIKVTREEDVQRARCILKMRQLLADEGFGEE
ncbi:MAG: 2-C-methyl-D-erythritol 4-phosphate cytidylyltransferase [Candidatus Krumholzibacteriia bacterium]